jgi:hypothetical protein
VPVGGDRYLHLQVAADAGAVTFAGKRSASRERK